MNTFFVTGIDTDAGKTIVTGHIAAYLKSIGKRVITQKMVQTGCEGIAEDILTHRKIMGTELLAEDHERMTCPQTFSFPASPHLAAALENRNINLKAIEVATTQLQELFEYVLIEGAGGLHVPITEQVHVIDYIEEQQLPVILVTSSKLGSINHTLLSLEVLKNREIPLKALVYNHYPKASENIFEDTKKLLQKQLPKFYPNAHFWELPVCGEEQVFADFHGILENMNLQ